MGGNLLANLLGYEGEKSVLDAACVLCAPMKQWKCIKDIKESLGGFYDRGMGKRWKQLIMEHEQVLREHLEEKLEIDFETDFKTKEFTLLEMDDMVTGPLNGYKDRDDLYYNASCCHRIPSITTPTFFMSSLDDPVVSSAAIEYENINANKHTVLGTTKFGGHIGYHTRTFTQEQWFMTPTLDFLDSFRIDL